MNERLPMPKPVLIAIAVATLATLLIALGGIAWWSVDGLAWFQHQGMTVLSVPLFAAFIVLLGLIWYRLFSAILDLIAGRQRD
ncbi:MAG: hypothetical protein FJX65_10760 [Alphaproteobacteria bacterium]|nr:hypothetical protein [Alphaproteobacteria bacterium]